MKCFKVTVFKYFQKVAIYIAPNDSSKFSIFTTMFIPEQFTVKANPALFEGEGEGEGEGEEQKKVSTNTFIPVYIHIHIYTKACFQNLGGCRSLHIVYIHLIIFNGRRGKKVRNTFIPVYIHIHIQNFKTKL